MTTWGGLKPYTDSTGNCLTVPIATYLLPVGATLTMVTAVVASTGDATTGTAWVDTIVKAPVLWAAVVVWTVSRIVEWIKSGVEHKRVEKSLIRSLFAEINVNLLDLKQSIAANPPNIYNVLRQKLRSPRFTPHITDSRQTQIYHTNISLLHYLNDDLIHDLVSFYGLLDDIRVQINSLLLPSYKTISVHGQVLVIKRLFETCEKCHERGQHIMKTMATRYPKLKLRAGERT